MKVVSRRGAREELLFRLLAGIGLQEPDIESVAWTKVRFAEWLVEGELAQRRCGSDKRGDFVTESFLQMLFDLSFERLRVFGLRVEDDIAAGDKRLNIREPDSFEQSAQVVHLDSVPANIYGAQECYVLGHGSCRYLRGASAEACSFGGAISRQAS